MAREAFIDRNFSAGSLVGRFCRIPERRLTMTKAPQQAHTPPWPGQLEAKHCGPRAVEAAENDLLGEALAALRELDVAQTAQGAPREEYVKQLDAPEGRRDDHLRIDAEGPQGLGRHHRQGEGAGTDCPGLPQGRPGMGGTEGRSPGFGGEAARRSARRAVAALKEAGIDL